jgi:hypothetical protein
VVRDEASKTTVQTSAVVRLRLPLTDQVQIVEETLIAADHVHDQLHAVVVGLSAAADHVLLVADVPLVAGAGQQLNIRLTSNTLHSLKLKTWLEH